MALASHSFIPLEHSSICSQEKILFLVTIPFRVTKTRSSVALYLSNGPCIPSSFISRLASTCNIIFVVKVAINSLATFCTVTNFQSNLSTFRLASAWPWSESTLPQTQRLSRRFWKIQTFVTNVTVTLVGTFFVDATRIRRTFLI